MTSDSTIDIGLDSRKPWIQAGTLRPKLDHNTGRHFDTPLRLVTSRPSFRQTRHLASRNISIIVHETSKFRYTWRESWCNCVWKTLYLNLYSQLASVEIHLRPFPHHGLGREHVIRHRSGIRVWLAEHPLRILFDFHSQSQGRCWYVRTALETLCTQIGGEWSASRAKENYWTLLESEFDSGSTDLRRIYQFIWHPGIWQHDRNNYIVTTNAQSNYILFEFCPSITNESWTDMHAESTQAPTCWH